MSDDKQDFAAVVAGIYKAGADTVAEPDGRTQRELEDKFMRLDALVSAIAPDGPAAMYDEWTRLRSLMTPEFRRKRDQMHGVVNDDYPAEVTQP